MHVLRDHNIKFSIHILKGRISEKSHTTFGAEQIGFNITLISIFKPKSTGERLNEFANVYKTEHLQNRTQ